ncbi:MAG: peroxiredoxin [Archangiaceae bacterium]|nr:peroxiredoxin [Archangiaceae bacterium]
MLSVGDIAPDFDTVDCRGERLQLSSFRGQRTVVLFFFPKAFSPACTLEVRNFRDNYQRITQLDAELIGVSVDKAERNCRFATEEGLQFRLIGDESRAISGLYGVVWPVLRIDRRATFVIGLDGTVEDVFHHEVQVYRHLEDVLDRLAAAKGAPHPQTAPTPT